MADVVTVSAAVPALICEEEVIARGPEWLASPAGQAAPWFVTLALKREIRECAEYLAARRSQRPISSVNGTRAA